MHYYTAFGLSIQSDIEIPVLVKTEPKAIDVNIITGNVSKRGLDKPRGIKPNRQIADNEVWLHVPEVARYHVSNGNRILVDPFEKSHTKNIILYLLGTCFGAIAHQRNNLVIHGNAIRFGDHCVIFAGQSGNGKSTLAAAFYQKGFEILADDVSVIDGEGHAQPSYPQMKLWPDTAEKLNVDITELEHVCVGFDKYAYPLTEGFCSTPLPVKAIYILNTHDKDSFIFEEVKGIDKFFPIKKNTYRKGLLKGLGLKKQHLTLSSKFASNIRVINITRPTKGFEIEKLVTLIEQHQNNLQLINAPISKICFF
mgnify:CR=1 FL=1